MKVYDSNTGEALERDSCDVREMIAGGGYTLQDPALAAAIEKQAADAAIKTAAADAKKK